MSNLVGPSPSRILEIETTRDDETTYSIIVYPHCEFLIDAYSYVIYESGSLIIFFLRKSRWDMGSYVFESYERRHKNKVKGDKIS